MNEILKNLQTSSKEDLRMMVESIKSPVLNGDVDPLNQLIAIKKLLFVLEEAEAHVRSLAEEKTYVSRGEKLNMLSCEVSEKDNARYDYKSCNDPVLNKAQDTIKERQAFLKTLKEKIVLLDEETGETFEVMPPIKSGKISLNISIK